MKYIITFLLSLGLLNICLAQEEVNKNISLDESHEIENIDSIIEPLKATIMSSRNSWTNIDNDSVLNLLMLDSLAVYSYIKNNIIQQIDSIGIFEDKWDTLNTFAHGYMNFKDALDTVAIPLLVGDSSQFAMPININRVCCPYGWRRGRMHNGVDLKLHTGDSVVAAFDGVVRYAKWNRGGFGYLVIIRHNNGLETYYAHLSKLLCKSNQTIKAGELIALGGNTGRSSGPHLHFEIRHRDNPFNPEAIIDFEQGKLKSDILYFIPNSFKNINNKSIANVDYHIINNGDTLWKISRKYGVSLKYLCSLNGLKESSILRIGQKIRIR